MMTSIHRNQLTFTTPLTRSWQDIARKFSRQQSNPAKAERIYRNTLAVLAVNFYCKCMGIATDLEESDSWDPVMQTLSDVADLQLKNIGKIECCSLSLGSELVEIPAEAWGDRIGYVAVQFSESAREATLYGFIKTVEMEEMPLSQFQTLENFLDYIHQLQPKPAIHLTQWLHHVFEAGWDTVEAILGQQKTELAFNVRRPSVKRGKVIELTRAGETVALVVGMKPAQPPEMDIWVEVYPIDERVYLPPSLNLMILDAEGVAVMQAQARNTKNIQLNFSGEPGEQFSVKVTLDDVSVTEAFII
ncbi:DUF1822 family protein [Laspinema olomoucense]|uniref:DUF1822 family protein n=1 Tax=Laspinema olomoucense TaxID=3231600 RepID=UPI0021BA9449|nr:DUF1822 family protein [Laspinema sp. D3d]MCT7973689.1 DUF1822 family protein [Laspinema sp. D3d]